MTRAFVGLGSNLGDRLKYLSDALAAIRALPQSRLIRWSGVYETEPVGKADQPVFLNMAAEVETGLDAVAFLSALKGVERLLGRQSTERWGPREIDLDILYFGTAVLNDAGLKIPHPEIANRRFVLVPLRELVPDHVDPLRQRTVQELLRVCPDTHTVRTTQLTVHPTE